MVRCFVIANVTRELLHNNEKGRRKRGQEGKRGRRRGWRARERREDGGREGYR